MTNCTIEQLQDGGYRLIVYPELLNPYIKIVHDFKTKEEMEKCFIKATEDKSYDVI